MNALSLYMPMYDWKDVIADLQSSPKDAAANVRRGIGTARPAQVTIVKFKGNIDPIHDVRQIRKRGAPNARSNVSRTPTPRLAQRRRGRLQ